MTVPAVHDAQMRQIAPYPQALADLVARVAYRPGWMCKLTDLDRGQDSEGLTLVITTKGYDSYHPERGENYRVHHYMPVPPAAFDGRSWQRWLFEQFLLVERHEAMEFFALRDDHLIEPDDECECGCPASDHDGRHSSCAGCQADEHRFQAKPPRYCRPYAPSHGPGNDPYLVREVGSDLDRRTSFRGEVNQ